jgi:hypothetical protein
VRIHGCEKCSQLWEAYESATFKRVRAENTLNIATDSYAEPELIQRLKGELDEAVQKLKRIDDQTAQHEAAAHRSRQSSEQG